jgi:hypothetical protein
MARTPAQIAADNELEAAIAKVLEVNEMLGEGTALGDFVVLCALPYFTEEKAGTTEYAYIMPGDGMPWHQALGLMDTHRILMTKEIHDDH